MSRLRRAVTGGRWVRPGRGGLVALGMFTVGVVSAAIWGLVSAQRSVGPARSLALAAAVSPRPIALDSALEVTWTWSVGGTAGLEDRWSALVAPEIPPGLCSTAAAGSSPDALSQALRDLDDAVRRRGSRDELERRIRGVRSAAAGAPAGGRGDFLARYGLARGYAAAGDWATAAEVLDPVFDGWLSPERIPDTDRDRSRLAVTEGRVDEGLATDAVHARHLAGTIAYHRGEAELAVGWFRRAINAVHYLLAVRGEDGLSSEGHYQRVVAAAGDSRCPGARSDDALTSLDGYAGLVAAYMADEAFRDPGGLPREVARTRLQIDPGDPFAPVLRHARTTRGDPELTPIPENLLWAASNLQRVYHHNRLRPDPRLEVTRAVLLLRLTGDSAWAAALRTDGGAETCSMLGGLAGDLRSDAGALRTGRPEYGPTDSARAAVAVQTFARLDRGCPGAEAGDGGARPRVDPAVRSEWIRLGGGYLTRGVGSELEGIRVALVEALGTGSAPPRVIEARLEPPLARAASDLRALRAGRVPSEMPADLPVDPVRRYVEEWWRALFADVATTLAARAGAGAEDAEPLRAGEVDDYLAALESAVAHAGLRPSDVYSAAELSPLVAGARGDAAALAWRIRTAVRDRPGAAALVLVATGAVMIALAFLVHVGAWRYRLVARNRLYAAELARAAGGDQA